jgi:hypothetical protein
VDVPRCPARTCRPVLRLIGLGHRGRRASLISGWRTGHTAPIRARMSVWHRRWPMLARPSAAASGARCTGALAQLATRGELSVDDLDRLATAACHSSRRARPNARSPKC